jgi:alpha-1,6-mannosyltransferase
MLLSLILMDTRFAPFTKVEESFNLHATHDVIMYGVGSSTLHNVNDSPPKTFVKFLQPIPILIVRSLHISGCRSTYFRRQCVPWMGGETVPLDSGLGR